MRISEHSGDELVPGGAAAAWNWLGVRDRLSRVVAWPAFSWRVPDRWRWILVPLGLAFGARILLAVIVPVAVAHLFVRAYSDPLHIWLQKDAVWYVRIARDGYFYLPDSQSSACFFPLFPLAMRLVYPLTGLLAADRDTGYFLAGVLVSWLAFAGACAVLYRLVETRFDQRAAFAAVLLLSVYPFGWYFGVAFTESLFLLLVVVAFLGVERRNWWLAGLAAGLASASRPPGLVVGACVALAYGLDWLRTWHPLRLDALALGLAPLGAVAYLVYCWMAFGTPQAYLRTSEAGWQRGALQLGGLQQAWQLLTQPGNWLGGSGMDIRAYGLYSICSYWCWPRLGPLRGNLARLTRSLRW